MKKMASFVLCVLFIVVVGFLNMKPLFSSTGDGRQEETPQIERQFASLNESFSFGDYHAYEEDDDDDDDDDDEGDDEE